MILLKKAFSLANSIIGSPFWTILGGIAFTEMQSLYASEAIRNDYSVMLTELSFWLKLLSRFKRKVIVIRN